MKVCQILAGTGKGGLEKHTIELSNLLNTKEIDVTVIGHQSFQDEFQNINFIPLDMTKSRHNLLFLYKLLKILRKEKFDIIHTQANKATNIIVKLKQLQRVLPAKFLNQLANHDALAPLMASYNNSNVRAGDYTSPQVANGFVPFIEAKYKKEIEKLKTEKAKAGRITTRDELVKFITDNHTKLVFAYEVFSLLAAAKMMIVAKLNKPKR